MSRVVLAPDHGQLVEATPRVRLTPKERARLLDQQNDCCGGCGETLVWAVIDGKRVYGPMIDEHLNPLDLAGSNDLSNRAMYCVPCAKAKTAKKDAPDIAKARRIRFKNAGGKKPGAGQIRSRGFQKFSYPDFGEPS